MAFALKAKLKMNGNVVFFLSPIHYNKNNTALFSKLVKTIANNNSFTTCQATRVEIKEGENKNKNNKKKQKNSVFFNVMYCCCCFVAVRKKSENKPHSRNTICKIST